MYLRYTNVYLLTYLNVTKHAVQLIESNYTNLACDYTFFIFHCFFPKIFSN